MNRTEKLKQLHKLYEDIRSLDSYPTWSEERAEMRNEAYKLEKELGLKHKVTPSWLKEKQ